MMILMGVQQQNDWIGWNGIYGDFVVMLMGCYDFNRIW